MHVIDLGTEAHDLGIISLKRQRRRHDSHPVVVAKLVRSITVVCGNPSLVCQVPGLSWCYDGAEPLECCPNHLKDTFLNFLVQTPA